MSTKDEKILSSPQKPNPHAEHRERMRDKLRSGAEAFAPHEILEILLYGYIPYKDTNVIAHDLLAAFGSLEAVLRADLRDLAKVKGMTANAAVNFAAIRLLYDRVERGKTVKGQYVRNFAEAEACVRAGLDGKQREEIIIILLNTGNKLLGQKSIAIGTFTSASFNIRTIVDEVVRTNANKVLLGHNHTSGSFLPSRNDIETTAAVAEGLSILGVQLLDHIIVSDSGSYSLKMNHLLDK
ncbi:MAG: DNA repair protein RadC [Clostridiales bacterium]|nr:DNA repair protein RadC [Clostridiales bacterium]